MIHKIIVPLRVELDNMTNNNYLILAEEGDIIGEKKLISQWFRGSLHDALWHAADGSVWQIVITGVGAINVIRSLMPIDRHARLINIGYAGSADFDINSAVMVTEARLNHPCVTYPEPPLTLEPIAAELLIGDNTIIEAPCYSGADFVLQSDFRHCAFDMELAYIASMGFQHLSALKIVSDNLSLHDYRKVAAGVEKA